MAKQETFFHEIIQRLAAAGIPSPRLESRMILCHVLNISEQELILYDDDISTRQADEIWRIVAQRCAHKPLCKILGHKEFYKYDFCVSEDVLSPRPDTEILVEKAIELAQKHQLKNMIDFGLGSGCILLSVLAENQSLRGTGVDISDKALVVAQKNAERLNVANRCRFVRASWMQKDITETLSEKYDLFVSNPPYIPSEDIKNLDVEVKDHDPLLALDGGQDGLRDYRRLSEIATELLNPKGFILLEVGINQSQQVSAIFEQRGFICLEILSDLGGIERCIVLQKA